jgi:hypothetical protein
MMPNLIETYKQMSCFLTLPEPFLEHIETSLELTVLDNDVLEGVRAGAEDAPLLCLDHGLIPSPSKAFNEPFAAINKRASRSVSHRCHSLFPVELNNGRTSLWDRNLVIIYELVNGIKFTCSR